MIKKTLTICAFALFTILYNCDNEPYDGDIFSENNACTLAILETNNAATDYFTAIQENANEYCLIYKNALENQIEMCGDENGTLQLIIEELDDCVIEPDLCELAIAATEVAQENYENTTNNDFEEMCNLYKEALQYQIVVCGDDGTLQSRISELGDCEPVYLDTIGTWKLVSWLTDQSLDIDNDGVVTNDYLEEENDPDIIHPKEQMKNIILYLLSPSFSKIKNAKPSTADVFFKIFVDFVLNL